MALPAFSPLRLVILFAFPALLLSACDREEKADLAPEVNRLKGELEATGHKLTAAQKNLEVATAELDLARGAAASAKAQLAEKEQAAVQKDQHLLALQTEIDTIKKRDAFVFAEITAVRRQGLGILALSQYQKFVADFPNSALLGPANSAIAELTAERARDSQRWANMANPKRKENEVLKHFGDGLTTLAELAPILKGKTLAQVRTMLGRPDRTFNEGTEIGYVDKALNPRTNRPGLLIVGFEEGNVSSLRVEYAGQKMVP